MTILYTNAICQKDKYLEAQLLFYKAERFCEQGDTAKALKYIGQIDSLYPFEPAVLKSHLLLGNIYFKQKKNEDALKSYLYAIGLLKRAKDMAYIDTSVYEPYRPYLFFETNGNLYLAINKAYQKKLLYDSALYYLKLADSTYKTYRDCGNGAMMYRCQVANHFINYYMAIGDTNTAMKTMFNHLLNTDGNRYLFIKKLKSILLLTHSQKAITREVKNGLNRMRIIQKDSVDYVELKIFGFSATKYGSGPAKLYKAWFKKDEMIQYLMNENFKLRFDFQ